MITVSIREYINTVIAGAKEIDFSIEKPFGRVAKTNSVEDKETSSLEDRGL